MNKHLAVIEDYSNTGHLSELVHAFYPEEQLVLLYLNNYQIHVHHPEGKYPKEDEFYTLIRLLSRAEKLTFATPIRWGQISGLMKVFMDRFLDQKVQDLKLDQKWYDKPLTIIADGHPMVIPENRDAAFKLFARKYNLNYKGMFYWTTQRDPTNNLFKEEREDFLLSIG
jgi:multimeric flavodoxin WrbA